LDLTKANAQLVKVSEQLAATYAEIEEAKDAALEETQKAKLLMVALQQETQVHLPSTLAPRNTCQDNHLLSHPQPVL
jgi:hypothetical protein